MQTSFSSQPLPAREAVFVDDDVVCPVCDAYEVEEQEHNSVCLVCGISWKTIELL